MSLASDKPTPPLALKMLKSSAVGGVVEDEDDEPLRGMRVYLFERFFLAGDPLMRPYKEAVTDNDGEFSFVVSPGKYYVYATPGSRPRDEANRGSDKEGTRKLVGTFYPDSREAETAVAVQAYAGSPVMGLRLQLQKTARYTVSGRLEEAEGHIRRPRIVRDSAVRSSFLRAEWFFPLATRSGGRIGGEDRGGGSGTGPVPCSEPDRTASGDFSC